MARGWSWWHWEITLGGEKIPLGFVQRTENERALAPFLRSLIERGLDPSGGLLVVIDGAKGLYAAITKAFECFCLVQRCQWHKRRNVVAHLPKDEQPTWRRPLQADERPSHTEAKRALGTLHDLSCIHYDSPIIVERRFYPPWGSTLDKTGSKQCPHPTARFIHVST